MVGGGGSGTVVVDDGFHTGNLELSYVPHFRRAPENNVDHSVNLV